MKQQMKAALIHLLAPINKFPTPVTKKNELAALIRKLQPVADKKGLIRLGPKGDGGYLVPNDLAGLKSCFSPGVCEISGFENDCAELGMKVFLADKSVDGPASQHEAFAFTKKFVGVTSNADFMTMEEWINESIPDKTSELLLQIDIEGYEYEVFLNMPDSLMKRFRIIVAEFHQLDQLWSKPFFRLGGRAFDKILQTHSCVHIHPNNCCPTLAKGGLEIPRVMEFTFLRNDRIEKVSRPATYPHALDYDNTDKPTLVLPRCWQASE